MSQNHQVLLHFKPLIALHPQGQCLAEWGSHDWRCPTDDILSFYAQCVQGNTVPHAICAYKGDALMGSIAVLKHEMGDAQPVHREYWVGYLVVSPQARGMGVGRALIAQMRTYLKHQHIKTAYCYTANQASLYAFLGWQVLEEVMYLGDSVTIMQMDI